MPEKPFRASLVAGDRTLGDVQGAMEEVTEGGVTAWRGHFEWHVSPGLLMSADDLRLHFPEAEGGRVMFINAHTRQLDPAAQPPFRFDFRSAEDPSPVDERKEAGQLPNTMQDRHDPEAQS